MNREQQIEWEARWGRPAAAAAVGGILLPIVATLVQQSSLDSRPASTETVQFLRLLDRQPEVFLTSSVIQGIGSLALAGVFAYLFRVVKFRRPELPSAALVLGLLGPALLAVAAVLDVLDRLGIADTFFGSGAQTKKRADELIVDRSSLTIGIGLAGTIALTFAVISISLAAMRAGVVSRFLGLIGVIVGVLYVLGPLINVLLGQTVDVFNPAIIQFFWLGAMAALFLGRWPGGRGPAWASGEPEPWPSQMEMARRREEQAQRTQAEPQEPAAAKPRRKKRR